MHFFVAEAQQHWTCLYYTSRYGCTYLSCAHHAGLPLPSVRLVSAPAQLLCGHLGILHSLRNDNGDYDNSNDDDDDNISRDNRIHLEEKAKDMVSQAFNDNIGTVRIIFGLSLLSVALADLSVLCRI